MTDNIRKLNECLKNDPELQERVKAEVSRLLEGKETVDPGEATVKAINTVMDVNLTEEDLKSLPKCCELSPDAMENVVGGQHNESMASQKSNKCNCSPTGEHVWAYTGTKRPGTIWGSTWPDYLYKCKYCGKEDWRWINF